ncbi:TetR/AcrR family transcriptional regulator [Parvularcula maris]|uniref:TetR family transcriptional regulator n=1 Tax=Parvularcula maris TaxID=2965077 RepID=A0A9X2LB49_9PROT|nr:TetR/AcrR family transcriptional regulator [Parvularcula maris]MCQ8186471.1 TetR family transcriptional regulator [Parvularcula maris]
MTTGIEAQKQSQRFEKKRALIVGAATAIMNAHGVKGMTLSKVGQAIDLNTTSVTYYFKRKELLAEAILEDAIERYLALVDAAADEQDAEARIRRLVWDCLSLFAAIRSEEAPPIANLSHLLALDEPTRSSLLKRYLHLFRNLRALIWGDPQADKSLVTARTQVLMENLFWSQAWLPRYSLGDFERVAGRLVEVLTGGVAAYGATYTPQILTLDQPSNLADKSAMNEAFLRSATIIMNERGYRGASVERITRELSVTKGSFYHHLSSKDDLVLACFDLSYTRVSLAQRAAQQAGGSYLQRLTAAISTLLHIQFYGEAPLLRTTALSALPWPLRGEAIERSNRMARRFAGMLIDGITEGSVRPIDPLIASQSIMAALNTAFEMRRWAAAQPPEKAIGTYGSIVMRGILPQTD